MLDKKIYYDANEDKTHIVSTQDVEPIFNNNKRQYNDAGGFKSEVFNKKASIPFVVLFKWLQEKGIRYDEFMQDPEGKILRRFLNDPDNKFCLTRPGKV